MKNWKSLNPDWNYFCLNDSDLRKMCYSYSDKCGKAYDMAQYMHAKIDLGRVVSIYMNGGIMVDMDMYILRSLNSLPEMADFINTKTHKLGVSKLDLSWFESLIYSGEFDSYNNAVIISSQKNPLLKKWIDCIVNNIFTCSKKKYTNSGLYIFRTSGPNLFSKCIKTNKNESELVVFDNTTFEPCETFGKCDIKNNTISIHRFELSWVPKEYKYLMKFYFQYVRDNAKIGLGILLVLIVLYFTKNSKVIKK
jgi:mannosyltransferase OCH1-like enzyme